MINDEKLMMIDKTKWRRQRVFFFERGKKSKRKKAVMIDENDD